MKQITLIFFVLISTISKAQVTFFSNVGTEKWSSITILVDTKHTENSIAYYTGHDLSPTQMKFTKDTLINSVRVVKATIGSLPYKYYLSFDGLRTIALYNQNAELVGNYVNDSVAWNATNKKQTSLLPSISPQQMMSAAKILMLLL